MQPAGTKADLVLEELDRILASPGFIRNERLGCFLRFVTRKKIEGRTGELKETVIGAEVFGRKPDYDPRRDAVVRMEASRLRARLAEYYAGPGARDVVRIEIPKGAYVPQWQVGGGVSRAPHWKWAVAASVALCLMVGGFAAWRWTRPIMRPAVAVLAFLNLSSDPGSEYVSDGLTEEITARLSQVEGLEVTSRTSSFALKGSQLGAREIGARLNATVLLEGSVRKSGDQLRITAQLIRAADGKHLWSNTYDRRMRDVFAVQEEIAGSIVEALRLKLHGVQRRYSENIEANQLYWRGRYAFEHRQGSVALQYFEQAAARDPNYALVDAGTADALLMMELDHVLPYSEAHPRAKAAVDRALQLDPTLSEAHTVLAEVNLREYRWREAERSFRRAIELNPNNALAHLELGWSLLAPLERFEEAERQLLRASALDPLSWRTNYLAGFALLLTKNYQEAIEQSRKAITLDPSRAEPYMVVSRTLSLEGKQEEALAAAREADRRGPDGVASWVVACVSARAGQREEAVRLLQWNLDAARRGEQVPNRRLLMFYACLGDKERAFEYLDKMYTEREAALPVYFLYHELAWMRPDPRFASLRQRIGLPP